jgi:haloalkane dehalogenase
MIGAIGKEVLKTAMTNILRTPDTRFAALPDFPFEPRYVDVNGLRMHYVDEGPRDAAPVLLLHGEPTWSYLYRHMIPPLAGAGLRVVAPDLVGFGRSDKPAERGAYSYGDHVAWMTAFVERTGLDGITLFCQDWGSLIGLRVAAENQHRFARIVLANGGLPTGDEKLSAAFHAWRGFARASPWFPVGRIVQKGTLRRLPGDVVAAYDAPFPDRACLAGPRALPLLVPVRPNDPASAANRRAWEVFRRWKKPFLTAFSSHDPITRGGERVWQERVPGARNQVHVRVPKAGHFLQEDRGPELATVILRFIDANPA